MDYKCASQMAKGDIVQYNTSVIKINQSINQYIAFLLCRRSLGYILIYIIPIGLGTIANVKVLQFCI